MLRLLGSRGNAIGSLRSAVNPLRAVAAVPVGRALGGGALSSASNWMGVSEIGVGSALGGSHNLFVRWATKKAAGTVNNTEDSPGKALGLKVQGGAFVKPGNIVVRQRGTQWHPGMNVSLGRDHTISALIEGHVRFTHTLRPWRRGGRKYRTWVSVIPEGQDPAILRAWIDANQQRYLRIITDRYHGVPANITTPRERAAKRVSDAAIAAAEAVDEERRSMSGFAVVGPSSLPIARVSAVPTHPMPLRANTVVSRVHSAHSIFGERAIKPPRQAPRWAPLRKSLTAMPTPTVAPKAAAAAAAAAAL